jgi:hypothetical protein
MRDNLFGSSRRTLVYKQQQNRPSVRAEESAANTLRTVSRRRFGASLDEISALGAANHLGTCG